MHEISSVGLLYESLLTVAINKIYDITTSRKHLCSNLIDETSGNFAVYCLMQYNSTYYYIRYNGKCTQEQEQYQPCYKERVTKGRVAKEHARVKTQEH